MKLEDRIEVKSGLYVVESITIDNKVVNVLKPNPNLSDEEFLLRDPYLEMIEKSSEEKNFQKTVMTQRFVNDYLKSKGLETITERRAKSQKRDILGILTLDYKIELQKIVYEYAINNNIDLFPNQDRKGSILGVMSFSEKRIADFLIENYAKHYEEEQQNIGLSK